MGIFLLEFASSHREYKFLVTRIGCGIAGFTPNDIAPLFLKAIDLPNVILPKDFVEVMHQHSRETEPQPTAEQKKALKMWTMGAGNSAKRFSGENPIPPKKEVATKESWTTQPMPDNKIVIPLDVTIPSAAMNIVRYGHIPEAMEDHWFMYCDDTTIRYYRSWTGICIYVAKYEDDGSQCRITELQVNREPSQYKGKEDEKDVALFMALLTEEYGGDAKKFWEKAL